MNFLGTNDLITILNSKHGKYEEIHKSIWSRNYTNIKLMKYLILNSKKIEIEKKRLGMFMLKLENLYDNELIDMAYKSKNKYMIGALNLRFFNSDKLNLNIIRKLIYLPLSLLNKIVSPITNMLLSIILILITITSISKYIEDPSNMELVGIYVYIGLLGWYLFNTIIKYIFRGINYIFLNIASWFIKNN